MKVQQQDLLHGAALMQVVEHPGFKALNKAPDGKYGHYVLNNDTRLFVKYTTGNGPDYWFTAASRRSTPAIRSPAATGSASTVAPVNSVDSWEVFYVPGAAEGKDEQLYAELAKACGRAVPALDRRIESVEFIHDGINYIATVGRPPDGTKYRQLRSGREDYTRPPKRLTHGNTVLAIFSGTPYLMWTALNVRPSYWANPAMIGQPSFVRYFEAPGPTVRSD